MPKKKGPVELPPVNEGVWFAGGGATVSADDEGTAHHCPRSQPPFQPLGGRMPWPGMWTRAGSRGDGYAGVHCGSPLAPVALPAPSAAITAYSPSGDFKTDYLAYCKIWGLTVHPQIVRSWNAIQYEAGTRSNRPRSHALGWPVQC